MEPVSWKNNKLYLLDQTKLPNKIEYILCKNLEDIKIAIKEMKVRGAPLIGIVAAYGVALEINNSKIKNYDHLMEKLNNIKEEIIETRPTGANLAWAVNRLINKINKKIKKSKSIEQLKLLLLKEARRIHTEDKKMCLKIAELGSSLIKDNSTILTHCNAGALATGGVGTALGIIIYAYKKQKKKIKVYVDETRPLLQGARLSCFELLQAGIQTTLICDNMAASLMAQKKIDMVITGADRIAKNGDVANKIGTYSLAALAYLHNIPFYVAAPTSTIDREIEDGSLIKIEQRKKEEITHLFFKEPIAPVTDNLLIYNPAFDVTSAKFITAIITEEAIHYPPYNF